jgi:hypothetical protein
MASGPHDAYKWREGEDPHVLNLGWQPARAVRSPSHAKRNSPVTVFTPPGPDLQLWGPRHNKKFGKPLSNDKFKLRRLSFLLFLTITKKYELTFRDFSTSKCLSVIGGFYFRFVGTPGRPPLSLALKSGLPYHLL